MAITTDLDKVRLEIGDTSSAAPQLNDDEIEYLITQESSLIGAAARCCEVISRKLYVKADVALGRGGTRLTYSTAAAQYGQMAKDFRKRANASNAPWAGGRSIAEKESLAADPDAVQPLFSKDLMNSPWTGPAPSFIADQD